MSCRPASAHAVDQPQGARFQARTRAADRRRGDRIPGVALLVSGTDADTQLALILVAVQLSYFFILEATVGQTLGKQVMGLKVVRLDGAPAGRAGSSVSSRRAGRS